MILIISEESDTSTDIVCDWLAHYKEKFIRVNLEECFLTSLNIQLSCDFDIVFSTKNLSFKYSSLKSVWFRRGYLKLFIPDFKDCQVPPAIAHEVNIQLRNNLFEEHKTLSGYIYSKLMELPHLGNPNQYNINKLVVLDSAIKAGLKVPNTIITTKRETFEEFRKKENQLITKSIQNGLNYVHNNFILGQKTEVVTDEINIPTDFFPSLFQRKIESLFELRVFIINNQLFSAARFAPFTKSENIDIRFDSADRPTRIVPYTLPLNIQNKLLALMRSLKLNTGSIDMIVNRNQDYVFLEVNPAGQFQFLSKVCNFQIEQKIADFLANPIYE